LSAPGSRRGAGVAAAAMDLPSLAASVVRGGDLGPVAAALNEARRSRRRSAAGAGHEDAVPPDVAWTPAFAPVVRALALAAAAPPAAGGGPAAAAAAAKHLATWRNGIDADRRSELQSDPLVA
jgi:hypothetical protein